MTEKNIAHLNYVLSSQSTRHCLSSQPVSILGEQSTGKQSKFIGTRGTIIT